MSNNKLDVFDDSFIRDTFPYREAQVVEVKNLPGSWIKITEVDGQSLVATWISNELLNKGYLGIFNQPISFLGVDRRTINALNSCNIKTIGQLCDMHSHDLQMYMPGIGKKTVRQIVAALKSHNLSLRT